MEGGLGTPVRILCKHFPDERIHQERVEPGFGAHVTAQLRLDDAWVEAYRLDVLRKFLAQFLGKVEAGKLALSVGLEVLVFVGLEIDVSKVNLTRLVN